jgi:phage terminase large subunit
MQSSHSQKPRRAQNSLIAKAVQFAEIINDPSLFAEVMLGQSLWAKQREILQSVAAHPRTAVKACHASGKTFTAAVAALWWVAHRKRGIVVTTAPTWGQVERVIWGEIHRLAHGSLYPFGKPLKTELYLAPDRYITGLSTNDGLRFQGFHGDVLIISDEAPGVLPGIWEAIEGIRAGGDVRVLALGNPVISSGPFYDAFASQRSGWNQITISAFDTPNCEGVTLENLLQLPDQELDRKQLPFLTLRRWVKEKFHEWGPGHQLWESRVMGNFPMQSDSALFWLTWLEQAKVRELKGEGEFCAGLDVGGPGEDETVLCVRRGAEIVLLKAWAQPAPRGDVIAALRPFQNGLKSINVDTVGIGYGMGLHLRDHKLPVREVNVGVAAREKEKYVNLKAQLYWEFRERAKSGDLSGLADDEAISQLASIQYSHNSKGQIEIESKKDALKRGVTSPDRAEAIILAFADIRMEQQGLMEWYSEETGIPWN